MAKTIDEVTLKVGVDGLQTLDQAGISFTKLDNSIQSVQKNINGFRASIIANQIQDMAVQAEMGTNWTRILAQQLPQVGAAFGAVGAVVGGVAAVFFATLQPALRIAGIDIRNLKEITDDYEKSVKNLIDAQKQNQTTLTGLGNAYGSLTESAKKYFEIQQQISQTKATADAVSQVNKLKTEYTFLNDEVYKQHKALKDSQGVMYYMTDAFGILVGLEARAKLFGLTAEQAKELGNRLKQLDPSNLEKSSNILSDTAEWITEATKGTKNWELAYKEVIEPINKANKLIIEQATNIKNAAEQASKLQTELLGIQNTFQPDINAAKRNFDQYGAIALEKKQKLAEFDRQMEEKAKDGVDRTAEAEAGRLRIIQEYSDKVKDVSKSQQEAFYAQQLGNERKRDELSLQGKIADLQLGQIDSLDYQATLEEKILRNIFDQQQANAAIQEMLRKRSISAEQASKLEGQAAQIRKDSDAGAEKSITRLAAENARSIRLQIEGITQQNEQKMKSIDLEQRIFLLGTNRQALEKSMFDLQQTRDKAIADLNNNNKLSDAEKLDAAIRIAIEYDKGKEALQKQYEWNEKVAASFEMGFSKKFKELEESFSNFKVAGMMVDSVWNNMSSSLDNFVETGKFKFADFARSVIIDLEKIALKSAVIGLFKSFGLGDIFTLPGRAAGGPVSSNTPYMVGEQGPELFIPNSSGNIVPNSRLGGGVTQVTYNINAVDAKSVAQLFAENRMTLLGTVESARRELPMRAR